MGEMMFSAMSCGCYVACSCDLEYKASMGDELAERCIEENKLYREQIYSQPDVVRFMKYVDKLPNGCWYWTGARSRGKGNRKWYGSFKVGKRAIRAHRFACEVLGGRDCPPEHHRDHICCFSMCVNPDHIEVVHKSVNEARKQERRANAL